MPSTPARERGRYEEIYRSFQWDIPARFNFAVDVVDRWARERDGTALIWENADGARAEYRYSDISRLTQGLASALSARGIGKGDRIIVMMPRIPHWQIAIVAALRLGAVPIPCIELLTSRDIDYRVRNSGAKAVICRASQVEKFASTRDLFPVAMSLGAAEGWLDLDAEIAAADDEFVPPPVASEDPAIMYYTSGSTGHPKGVLHSARALYSWRVSALHWLDLTPDDRIWCTADTGWSKAGTSILFGPWSTGSCAFFYDGPFVPRDRLRLLEQHRITIYCAPGTELNRLVAEDIGSFDLSHLRRTVSAGEALNPAIGHAWQKATGSAVAEAYGLTEALMIVLNVPGEPVRFGSMGRPAPGSTVAIVDDAGRRLPTGSEGHIAVLQPHPQMMLGYWQEPDRTAQCFVTNGAETWFLTGDKGTQDSAGYLWYTGRADDVINSSGYRIGPLEVENALLEHPAVQECAVVGSPDVARGEIVKAFIVLRAGAAASDRLVKELQDHVKTVTAPYKYPRAIEFVTELPKTMTGKIQRRALRDREVERIRRGA